MKYNSKEILAILNSWGKYTWTLENNGNWLVMGKTYLLDITDIVSNQNFFTKFINFSVVEYKNKEEIKLNFIDKFRIIRALENNLENIKFKIGIGNLEKVAVPKINDDYFDLNDMRQYQQYQQLDNLTPPISHAEGHLTTAMGYVPFTRPEFDLGLTTSEIQTNDIHHKIKEKARKVLDDSITKEDIITRKSKEEEFREKMESEKKRIRKLIEDSRNKYHSLDE